VENWTGYGLAGRGNRLLYAAFVCHIIYKKKAIVNNKRLIVAAS
jgi:hypothetical protein